MIIASTGAANLKPVTAAATAKITTLENNDLVITIFIQYSIFILNWSKFNRYKNNVKVNGGAWKSKKIASEITFFQVVLFLMLPKSSDRLV